MSQSFYASVVEFPYAHEIDYKKGYEFIESWTQDDCDRFNANVQITDWLGEDFDLEECKDAVRAALSFLEQNASNHQIGLSSSYIITFAETGCEPPEGFSHLEILHYTGVLKHLGSLEEIDNQTEEEAVIRIGRAKGGSLADEPSVEYLAALKHGLEMWLEEVNRDYGKAKIK